MTTLDKIREVAESELGVLDVTPETTFVSLVTDSLEMVSLIQALEDSLGVEIPDCGLFTVADLVKYAEAH
jgi:acyl carrier protein